MMKNHRRVEITDGLRLLRLKGHLQGELKHVEGSGILQEAQQPQIEPLEALQVRCKHGKSVCARPEQRIQHLRPRLCLLRCGDERPERICVP